MANEPINVSEGLMYYPADETFIFWDGRKSKLAIFPKKEITYIKTEEFKRKSALPVKTSGWKKPSVFVKGPDRGRGNGYQPIADPSTKPATPPGSETDIPRINFYTKDNTVLLSLKFKTPQEFMKTIENIMSGGIRFFNNQSLNVNVGVLNHG